MHVHIYIYIYAHRTGCWGIQMGHKWIHMHGYVYTRMHICVILFMAPHGLTLEIGGVGWEPSPNRNGFCSIPCNPGLEPMQPPSPKQQEHPPQPPIGLPLHRWRVRRTYRNVTHGSHGKTVMAMNGTYHDAVHRPIDMGGYRTRRSREPLRKL